MIDYGDVPEAVTEGMAEDEAIKARWGYVLGEMIWAMEQVQPNHDWEAPYYETLNYTERDRHEGRMQEGFRLFGKYFTDLWV